jgi:LysM repeat protein
MTSNDISPENAKERQAKVCPYLGLLQDPQTTLAFPSASNLCHHAKPLASPSTEYQRFFCLNGRQHTQCPVFSRSELAPLPPEISGSRTHKPLMGKPTEMRILLPVLIGCVVLIFGIIGVAWFFTGKHSLPGQSGSPTLLSGEIPLTTANYLITDIAITPNVDESAMPGADTPAVTPTGSQTPQLSQTLTRILFTPFPTHTQVPCGSPNTWVVYIVRYGDTLSHISQIYGITVAELQRANCLGNSTILHTGQVLYVPRTVPIVPSPTQIIVVIPTNTPSDTPVIIPPTDTATEPPVATATQPPIPTETPTDTQVSP